MSPRNEAPAYVADDELLARFLRYERLVRANGTVRPEAFMPDSRDLEPRLSVTRHLDLSDEELLQNARHVVVQSASKLVGRADFKAFTARRLRLDVVSVPEPENAYHAELRGWPPEKHARKNLALSIAESARFVRCPVLG
jgi:hypothetical protein